MNKITIIMFAVILLISCSSMDLPTIEQSNQVISQSQAKIAENDKNINGKLNTTPEATDLRIAIKLKAINTIMDNFAFNRLDDVNFIFMTTKQLLMENKSMLGINYTNYMNIDTGNLSVNLKKFRFEKIENNKIYGIIELEGEGNISVSGKYTGIPASISPDVYLYMFENIVFDVKTTDSGYVVITPQPKNLILKTKISIKLLEWKVPYYQEIPIKLTDIVKSMAIPIAIKPDIQFPLLAETYSKDRVKMANYKLEFRNTGLGLSNDFIYYRTDMDFKRK